MSTSANTIRIDIVSAEQAIYSGDAVMVVAPAALGEVGILPRHTPMLTLLSPGSLRVQHANGQEEIFYVQGGILEVQPNIITVLADIAERGESLDEAQAEAAKARAEKLLQDKSAEKEYAQVAAELARAVAQLQVIKQLRSRRKG